MKVLCGAFKDDRAHCSARGTSTNQRRTPFNTARVLVEEYNFTLNKTRLLLMGVDGGGEERRPPREEKENDYRALFSIL